METVDLTSSGSTLKRQEEASEAFASEGLPTRKHEAWRYAPTRTFGPFERGAQRDDAPAISDDRSQVAGPRVVIQDGHLVSVQAGDVPVEGLWFGGLADVPEDRADEVAASLGTIAHSGAGGFLSLNAQDLSNTLVIHLARGVVADVPVEVSCVSSAGVTSHPRVLVVTGRQSELTVVERHEGAGWSNHVTELAVGEASTLTHIKVLEGGEDTHHVGSLFSRVLRDGTIRSHVVALGSTLGRTDLVATLAEPGASCSLDGLFLPADGEHLDHHVIIDHASSNTSSEAYYKGVVDAGGLGGFVGRVLIGEGSTGCASHQLNRNLLLAEGGTVHSRPQLEIDNDDVQASHGSTIGELDREAIFYLRSRGIPEEAARAMLTWAFAEEMVTRIPVPGLRDHLAASLSQLLAGATGGMLAALQEDL